MRTALSCFLTENLPSELQAIYDIDPESVPYGIENGEVVVLPFLDGRKPGEGGRVITPLEDIPDLEAAAWKLLVHVARAQRDNPSKVFMQESAEELRRSGELTKEMMLVREVNEDSVVSDAYVVKKEAVVVITMEPEYMARHVVKDGKHGLMIYNPGTITLLSE